MAYLKSLPEAKPNHQDNRFDFLRLFAAWLVLFSHCYALGGWPGNEPLASTVGIDTLGGIGVAIFFVLSGYLVTISLERSPGLWVFARRRAVRIYPALVVACLLSILLLGPLLTTLPWLDYLRHAETWKYLRVATAWEIVYALPGVFETTPLLHAVNGSLWSLPYELRCYVVLALMSLLPMSLRIKTLIALVFLMTVVMLRPVVPPTSPFLDFWKLDYYHSKLGFLFAIGAVFASWREALVLRARPALLLMSTVFVLPHGNLQLLSFFLGLAILILYLALKGHWLPVIPARMGDWSYGTYLYGFPVQQLLASAGVHHFGVTIFLAVATVLTLSLAGLSWHFVEKPALRWK